MFSVELSDQANDDLASLDPTIARLIISRLEWLGENAESINHRALTGSWRGFYRLRVADYRALYTIDWPNRRIVIELVGHRSEVYGTR